MVRLGRKYQSPNLKSIIKAAALSDASELNSAGWLFELSGLESGFTPSPRDAWAVFKLLDSPPNKKIMAGSRSGWLHILHYLDRQRLAQEVPEDVSKMGVSCWARRGARSSRCRLLAYGAETSSRPGWANPRTKA
jgi:hypothetical protein